MRRTIRSATVLCNIISRGFFYSLARKLAVNNTLMQNDVTLGMAISQTQKAIAAAKRGLSLSNDNYMQGVRDSPVSSALAPGEAIREPTPYLVRTSNNNNRPHLTGEKEKQD